jgi:predicted unusual protein kinase regulating ubiquinone biosynthesis (AarF/ABC1/UbiB family)
VSTLSRSLERAVRTVRIGFCAACVWGRTRGSRSLDRLRGRDPDKRDRTPIHQRNADQILRTALNMRGLLIKMCQVIGTRSDVFPAPYVRTLSQTHDRVPPRPFEAIRDVVEQELGRRLDTAYSEFEPEPVAAASLAQVHRARLKSSGEIVAVKVQYPDIAHIVDTDLAATRRICGIYQRLDPQPMDLLPLLDELQAHLRLELDFRREVESADRVRELFKDDPAIRVPRVHRELSARRVITMEFVEGIKVTDRAGLEAAGISPRRVVHDLMSAYNRMILAYGFFQADPHPGNIFVRPGPEIILLDFGLSKQLPKGFGLGLFELMFSLMTFNESAMIRAFQELGFETRNGDPRTYVQIANRMVGVSEEGFQGEFTEEMTDELFDAIRENPIIQVPTDFVLVSRAFSLLSGIAHSLGTRANVLDTMGPSGSQARPESVPVV